MNVADTKIFNNSKVLIEGWYWAFSTNEVKRGSVKPFRLLDKDLAIWRGQDGELRAFDAFCPHMGAHLAEGKVEGNNLRCMFHNWRFDSKGACNEIPCFEKTNHVKPIQSWPVKEKYGLIWVYTGTTPRLDVPEVPELKGMETSSWVSGTFRKECHPSVMMINAIDEQHFASVHPVAGGLASDLSFSTHIRSPHQIEFHNQNAVPRASGITRFLSRFYRGALTYNMSYWCASTGSVSLGPDRQHFHIIFAIRPTIDGKSDGKIILVTKKRSGLFGAVISSAILAATHVVGKYFAHGDTKIFRSIRFQMKHPIPRDRSIVAFIHHTESQPLSAWVKEDTYADQKSLSQTTTRPYYASRAAESDRAEADAADYAEVLRQRPRGGLSSGLERQE